MVIRYISLTHSITHILDASTHLYMRVCPLVHPLGRLSVSLSHIFRCVHASLYEGLSVRGSVGRLVRNAEIDKK